MTGDYTKDTISVVKTLQTAVDTPKDSPNKDEVRSEALTLITDYISRYRNRGMVNKTQLYNYANSIKCYGRPLQKLCK